MIPMANRDERDALPSEWQTMTDTAINAALQALHVPTKLLGYRYIFLAVHLILMCGPRERIRIRRELYERIGACMDTTKPMINRSIRYAITQAWRTAEPEVLRSYLGSMTASLKDPPSNLEFIWLVAERVHLLVGEPTDAAYRPEERPFAAQIPRQTD